MSFRPPQPRFSALTKRSALEKHGRLKTPNPIRPSWQNTKGITTDKDPVLCNRRYCFESSTIHAQSPRGVHWRHPRPVGSSDSSRNTDIHGSIRIVIVGSERWSTFNGTFDFLEHCCSGHDVFLPSKGREFIWHSPRNEV